MTVDWRPVGSLPLADDPFTPRPARLIARREETPETATLWLQGLDGAIGPPRPGQFFMVWAFGVGEIPISVSHLGAPDQATAAAGAPGGRRDPDVVVGLTIRAVGAVSRALARLPVGEVVGLRGPFGRGWELDDARPTVVAIAGGLGLAPLRPAVLAARATATVETVRLIVGARAASQMVFRDEFERWQADGIEIVTTVDRPEPGWTGRVGLVTDHLGVLDEPPATTALLCGPEIMMRAAAGSLVVRGVPAAQVQLSLERAMKCGMGLCGRCQLGPLFVCHDGPVRRYSDVASILEVRGA